MCFHDLLCGIDDRVPRPLQNENVSFGIIVESLNRIETIVLDIYIYVLQLFAVYRHAHFVD